ncbi:MAG: hypothetical protein M3065_13005 [Actinomycetota bacterium]|nr:hypothetical protein [Actinomycetota bacterium]
MTVADPDAQGIPKPRGYTQAVSKWGSIRFPGQITVAAVDRNTRTAIIEVAIYPGYGMRDRAPHRGGFATVQVTLPLAGLATNYPDDSYELTFGSIFVLADLPSKPQLSYSVDLIFPHVAANVLNVSRVIAVPGRRLVMPDQRECDTIFSFVFDRAGGATFVWSIARLPIAFGLLVIQSYARERSRADTKLGIGTGATFITILTLHGVLVPKDISGVTQVDYLLGLESALFVWLLVVTPCLGWWCRRRRRIGHGIDDSSAA